jgi:hypothetical protein
MTFSARTPVSISLHVLQSLDFPSKTCRSKWSSFSWGSNMNTRRLVVSLAEFYWNLYYLAVARLLAPLAVKFLCELTVGNNHLHSKIQGKDSKNKPRGSDSWLVNRYLWVKCGVIVFVLYKINVVICGIVVFSILGMLISCDLFF